jgi:putative sigma-54 modulation protein
MVDKSKFIEEEALGYPIEVVGRGILVTDAMKNYAWDKMSKVERFGLHIMHVHIALDIQRLEHLCSIVTKFEHFPMKVQASSTDMYASIDKAIDRLQGQLRRWKEKIERHLKKKLSLVDMEVNILRRPYNELEEINAAISREEQNNFSLPVIIGKNTLPLKTLTVDEALMKIDLSGDSFLIFRDEVDQKIKVIYSIEDGNYGLVQPE